MYPKLVNATWKIATCNRLDLGNTRTWLIMPKNLSDTAPEPQNDQSDQYFVLPLLDSHLRKGSLILKLAWNELEVSDFIYDILSETRMTKRSEMVVHSEPQNDLVFNISVWLLLNRPL